MPEICITCHLALASSQHWMLRSKRASTGSPSLAWWQMLMVSQPGGCVRAVAVAPNDSALCKTVRAPFELLVPVVPVK